MRRIFWHVLQRNRLLYVGWGLIVIFTWANALSSHDLREMSRLPLVYSFMFEFLMATQVRGWCGSKVLRVVPLSRQQLGMTVWLLMAVAPALVVASAKLAAVGIVSAQSRRLDGRASWLLFSIAYDFAYAGSLCFLSTTQAGSLTGVRRMIVTGFTIVVGLGWLWLGMYLPMAWDQVTVWSNLLLALGLVLTVIGYARSAELGGDFDDDWFFRRRAATIEAKSRAKAVNGSPTTSSPFAGRLSGLGRLALKQFGWAAAIAALLLVAACVFTFLGWTLRHKPWDMAPLIAFVDFRTQNQLLWIVFLFMGLSRWIYAMRPLRVLPLATWELSVLVVVQPVATWLAFCLVMSVTHLLLVGHFPPFLAVCAFAGALGVSCLANTLAFVYARNVSGFAVILITLILMRIAVELGVSLGHPSDSALVWTVLGFGGVVAAMYGNQKVLTTCDVIYKR